ncbi:MAG: ketoacyl-ACP synthase III [Syntrophaceticus sp.]|nr:ketoacyl-ACP synthase III [Syntrophaceticus sp.]MDD3313971.1 ketoacyl-ACP synthase III [Syntrophaceticus sp.]MDD4359048.1 ketoacyl-ACP synthase III [Syntrophaceticus sp.]MDD4782636.1 ketoacyl-ACP synthase III [Syntrophaceticus sp.]
MLKAQILGTGYAVPEEILSNADLEKMVQTSDDWIVSRTGIRYRRIAGDGVATSDLAYRASRSALEEADIAPEELDLIIVATMTPDMPMPATACLLQHLLKANSAAAFDLNAACTGFIYALATAENFLLGSDKYHHILVVGAEVLSSVVDFTDRNTCILFGDGAGAVLLGKGEGNNGIIATYLGADGRGSSLLTIPAGGSRHPASQETIDQRMHYMQMQGNEVYKFAVRSIPECAGYVLDEANLSTEDVDYFIMHQANIRILQAAAKKLKIPWEKVLANIGEYGNVSAASIPLVLGEAAEKNKFKTGDLLLLVGFGAGLTTGAALVRWGR